MNKETLKVLLRMLQEDLNLDSDELVSLYLSQKNYFDFTSDLCNYLANI